MAKTREMVAAVMSECGGPDVFDVRSVPEPEERRGWRRIDLRAAALNWHDTLVREGRYGSPLPHVPGSDGAGVCRDTGEDVVILPSLWWGDESSAPATEWSILGDSVWGTHADSVLVPAEVVFPKPRGLTWGQAAALPLVGVTVYRALVTRARLAQGEHLLVLGAGGGVATMAVLLARAVGARVTVTSSSTRRIDAAVDLGAEAGVLYSDPDWPHAARGLTDGSRGFDVVLDSVGTWTDSVRALATGGRLVVLGASRAEQAVLDVRGFYFGQYSVLGTTMGDARDFRGLLDLVGAGRLTPPPVAAERPLAEIADAHRALESGESVGKQVLTCR